MKTVNVVNIPEIRAIAISEQAGMELRKLILKGIDTENQVLLDFQDVKIFTTMFFNSSIGYFVLNYGDAYVKEHIEFTNLSDLGRETLEHSISNAKIARKYGSDDPVVKVLDQIDP